MRTGGTAPIERASSADLVMLAMDAGGRVPEQMGALLVLDAGPGFDLPAAGRLLAERVRTVPRLRQRLVRVPPGCGRRVWVDDPRSDPAEHVRHVRCPAPGDEDALLDVATTVVTEALPASRPLWSAVFVTGLAGDRVGLIVVVHHVLADGIGGLAVLAQLVDPGAGPGPARAFPRPMPSRTGLAADALRSRLRAVARLPAACRGLRTAVAATGGLRAPRAEPCSLLRPTGPRRRVAVARADLAALRAAAHRYGGTVNDALLTALAGALHALLARRGESIRTLLVTEPVAARRAASAHDLGNRFAPLIVGLPGEGGPAERLPRIARTVHGARAAAMTGPSMVALARPVFRALAGLGLYRLFMAHQRRFHTLLSNVPGPDRPLAFAGAPIRTIVPVAVGEAGNATVNFVALSYAGTLVVTVVADPDRVPDLPLLASLLQDELDALTARVPAD
ncbi:MAG TPA: wax ester/triacylglycerol synthase domain-containing protein [Pseudonocardia sp.]|nr:wax ester/triacylglycerol synthase domain-containing protein [Pseudonocardia sp.]